MNIAKMFDEGTVDGKPLDESKAFASSGMDLDIEKGIDEENLVSYHKDISIIDDVEGSKKEAGKKLMSGKSAKEVLTSIRKTASKDVLAKALVQYVKSNEGVLGTVLVDCHLVESGDKLTKVMASSPFKKFAQFTVNCDCGCEDTVSKEEIISDNINIIDAALNTEMVEVRTAAICKKTGLPILKNIKAYGKQDAEQAIMELVRLGNISKAEAKTILASVGTPLLKVKRAFSLVLNRKDVEASEKYAGKVDTSAFKMKETKLAIDLQNAPEGNIVVDEKPCAIVIDVAEQAEAQDAKFVTEPLDLEVVEEEIPLEIDNTMAINDDYFEQDGMDFDITDQEPIEELAVDDKTLFDIDLDDEKV